MTEIGQPAFLNECFGYAQLTEEAVKNEKQLTRGYDVELITEALITDKIVSSYRRRSSVNFRGARHFCPKNMYEKLTKCHNFT